MNYLKYKLFIIFGLALFCALTYDYCRNSKKEITEIIEPTKTPFPKAEVKNKENIELGKIENFAKATELFEDFGKNTEKAKQKYIGKTFLIEGKIGEIFILRHGYPMPTVSSPVAGIMLIPETIKHFPQIPENEIDFTTLPYPRFIYSEESALLNEKKAESWYRQLDFAYYSEDFSSRSFFGGIYCMFSGVFFDKKDLDDPKSKKKNIQVRCKIQEYEKGGIEEITKYSDYGENKKEKVKSQPRVIAVGCVEITSE